MKKLILLVIILAVGIGLGIYFQRQPKAEKIENRVQMDAEQADADVKADAQKVVEFTTNAAGELKQNLP